jgi:adenylate cyclase
MAIEIERKFLLRHDGWRTLATRQIRISQAYLTTSAALSAGHERCSVRVRIFGESANLNIKSRELGARRQEFEYPIPLSDAESLMELASEGRIEKIRHIVPVAGFIWEIDEFFGDNQGLLVAEIELSRVDELFERPDWLGDEVTQYTRYYNSSLASQPYCNWHDEDKAC